MQPLGTLLPTSIASLCVENCMLAGKSLAIVQRLSLDPVADGVNFQI